MPLIVAAVILLVASRAMANSIPSLTGQLSDRELCPESICGSAIYAGSFEGTVDSRPTAGSFWTGVKHQLPLPTAMNNSVAITGGKWLIWTKRRIYSGIIEDGGTITANGDNTFTIAAILHLRRGGVGSVAFVRILDHNVFPPIIVGTIAQ
jgi:hypothetical protein